MTEAEYRCAVLERDNCKCLVCGRASSEVHEIAHRSDFPKSKQAAGGIFTLENGCVLCRKHHEELGSPYIGKLILRMLIYLKYGYERPALSTVWEIDTTIRYLMYVFAGWPRPNLKENL